MALHLFATAMQVAINRSPNRQQLLTARRGRQLAHGRGRSICPPDLPLACPCRRQDLACSRSQR